jgi:hypothetical protein
MLYALHVTVTTHDGDFEGSRSLPIFYLDSDVQGITCAEHAERIARGVINPLGTIAQDDMHVHAYAIGSRFRQRALTWQLAHMALTGRAGCDDSEARAMLLAAERAGARVPHTVTVAAGRLTATWSGERLNTFTVELA